jgi:hypothetical protein
VVRAGVRGGAEERGVRQDLERLAGEADEWGNLARSTTPHGGDDRRRGAAVAAAPHAAHRLDAAVPAAGRAQGAEAILKEVGFDEEADAALEQILTQTKSWADLAMLLHARADRAPDAASACACCSGSRSSRKSAWSTRPRRASPGRRSSRPSRTTSARFAR